jgi:hypothetical protein
VSGVKRGGIGVTYAKVSDSNPGRGPYFIQQNTKRTALFVNVVTYIVVKWLAHLLYVREVLGSDIGTATGCREVLNGFRHYLQEDALIVF